MKISLPQCRIDIRPSGNGGFARSGLVIISRPCYNGQGGSPRPCDNDWRSHPDLVIMAQGLIQAL